MSKIEPITFGIVAIGIAGGSLIGVHVLEQYGFKINQTMITIVLETLKAGGILYLINHLSKLFF